MNSTAPQGAQPTILVVETDANLRTLIAHTLKQAGYDAVLAPSGSGEATLGLISAADFAGLYREVQLPGRVDEWEVGATFSLVWPDKPTVFASALVLRPPGRLRKGIFLRKPFGLDRLVTVFDTSATAARARQALA
jgi:CheY-like chemotaxis protein